LNILIANVGCTSFKYKLFHMEDRRVIANGKITNIGYDKSIYTYEHGNKENKLILSNICYKDSVDLVLKRLNENSTEKIDAIGFKTVHGGEFTKTEILTKDILKKMKEYITCAPAHNKHYINVISIFIEKYPDLPLVGLFEPHFHENIPLEAKIYGVPYEWYEKFNVIKYGFHGASHHYISDRIKELNPYAENVISCHLGGSSSICAIKNGISIDTSFGFSLQSGIIHSNRCGDIDAFIIPFIKEKLNTSYEDIFKELYTNGGLKGISGLNGDLKQIELEAENGNERAELAVKKFIFDLKRYIGEYYILLEGLDALVFTGGIGENSKRVRRDVCTHLKFIGIDFDENLNQNVCGQTLITSDHSKIPVYVIPTNEELIVAIEVEKKLNTEDN